MKPLLHSRRAGIIPVRSPISGNVSARRARLSVVILLTVLLCRSSQPASWPHTVRETVHRVVLRTLAWWNSLMNSSAHAVEAAPPPAVRLALPAMRRAPRSPADVETMKFRTNSSRMDCVIHFGGSVNDSPHIAGGVTVIARIEIGQDIVMGQTQTNAAGVYTLDVPFTARAFERLDWSLSTQSVGGKFVETAGHRILTADDRQIRIDVDSI